MIELIFLGVVALLGGVFLIHTRLNDMEKKQDKQIARTIEYKKNIDRKLYDLSNIIYDVNAETDSLHHETDAYIKHKQELQDKKIDDMMDDLAEKMGDNKSSDK